MCIAAEARRQPQMEALVWLTRLALRNPILILMLSLMVVVLGLQSLSRLSVDLFPDLTIPVVRVVTFYTGAGPQDIEKAITIPVERAVAGAPGVERVESTSRQGASIVSAWFAYDTNLDSAQFEIQQRVSQILNTLPPGIQQPFVIKFDITNIPIVSINLSSDTLDERQLYDLAYNTIEPQLERLPGIATATPGGGQQREIQVNVHAAALRHRNQSILDVVRALRSANLVLPSGNLRSGDRDFNVFTNTQVHAIEELADVVVSPGVPGAADRPPIRVSDLAEVLDATADQANIVRINGARGVYLRLNKQPTANTIAVVDAVRAALPKLRSVPPGVQVAISFDQSSYIRAAVKSLEHEAIQGGALAILVILLFLLSVRATAIVAVAIPLSIIATFILLYFAGQTLNIFTLGGLALGVGRLVDDSIVELENIHRHLGHTASRKQAVLAAAKEVAMPILVSTITTIIVFLPVLFLSGIAKSLFIPLAMTISFALGMSFLVSRTVTPILCLRLLQTHGSAAGDAPRTRSRVLTSLSRGLDGLDAAYGRALTAVLRHRGWTVGVILALCGSMVPLYLRLGSEFFPQTDESQISLTFRTPVGSRVERTEMVAARLEATFQQSLGQPGQSMANGRPAWARTYLSDLGLPGGRTAIFTSNTGPHAGQLQVNLVPRTERTEGDVALTERLRASLREGYPGIQFFFFTGGIVKRILNFGSPAPIDIEILGYDLDAGTAYARTLRSRFQGLRDAGGGPVLTDMQISREENYPELNIEVDRQKAGVHGLSVQQVAETVLFSLTGSSQTQPIRFLDEKSGYEYPINVRLAAPFRGQLPDIGDLSLRTPAGTQLALSSLARVERAAGPVVISRKYLQRIVNLTANVPATSNLGQASQVIEKLLQEIPPPDGFTVRISGQSAAQAQAFSGLGWAGLLAVLLVYMVLAAQFKSLLDPLIILCSVPLGLAGVVLLLYATHTTISVNSLMGVIMMIGIVVSNGVLLVDYANVLQRKGVELWPATIDAAKTRLRPILMTTIATIVGLLPMAMGIGEGSETNLPLARAVIGGLTVSTFFTLFLIPTLYTLLGRRSAPDAGGRG